LLRPFSSLSKVTVVVLVLLLLACVLTYPVHAATTLTAYRSQERVTLDGIVEPGEWNDTPMISESTTGMTVAFKQNGTGLLFLMIWQQSSTYCSDQYCYGGIELGPLNNTQYMGSPSTPTLMILVSKSWGGVDELVSTGPPSPTPVEKLGYKTQTTCGSDFVSGTYTVECYRPFSLTNAWQQDFTLNVGSTVEIGFAVGECTPIPGDHLATDMATYVLTVSNQMWTPSHTTSMSTSLSQSATSSQSTSAPAVPVSLYALVQQYGPYLPLAAIVIAAIHFVRRKGWTGKSPW
jgi:hypothetical protein